VVSQNVIPLILFSGESPTRDWKMLSYILPQGRKGAKLRKE